MKQIGAFGKLRPVLAAGVIVPLAVVVFLRQKIQQSAVGVLRKCLSPLFRPTQRFIGASGLPAKRCRPHGVSCHALDGGGPGR